jgi:hypothetical protein
MIRSKFHFLPPNHAPNFVFANLRLQVRLLPHSEAFFCNVVILKRVFCNILTMHERLLACSHTVSNCATSNIFNNHVSVDFGASCEVFLQLFCAPMNKNRDICILRRKSCRSCSHAVMCDHCLLLRTSRRHRLSYIAHHSISATFLLLCFGILLRLLHLENCLIVRTICVALCCVVLSSSPPPPHHPPACSHGRGHLMQCENLMQPLPNYN